MWLPRASHGEIPPAYNNDCAPACGGGALCEPYGGGRQPPILPVAYHRMEWYNSEVFWAGVSAFCVPQSPLCRGRWHGAAVTKVIIPSRLPASQSHTKGFGLYACRRGGTFAPPRRTQPPLQSGRPSVALRAALSAAVRPPLPTRSCDLAGTPNSKSGLGQAPRPPRSSDATSASIGQTRRYTAGSPLRCGASSSPHKVLRPCGDPIRPLGTAMPSRSVG